MVTRLFLGNAPAQLVVYFERPEEISGRDVRHQHRPYPHMKPFANNWPWRDFGRRRRSRTGNFAFERSWRGKGYLDLDSAGFYQGRNRGALRKNGDRPSQRNYRDSKCGKSFHDAIPSNEIWKETFPQSSRLTFFSPLPSGIGCSFVIHQLHVICNSFKVLLVILTRVAP